MEIRKAGSRLALVMLTVCLCALVSCLQLESTKTLAEEEDLRVRDKNITQTRVELEEKMRRELDHIRSLQTALELSKSQEEAATEQLKEQKKAEEAVSKDVAAVTAQNAKKKEELAKLQNELQLSQTKAEELKNTLATERSRIAAREEILEREASRTEEVWLKVSQASEELKKLEIEDARLKKEIASFEKRIFEAQQVLEESQSLLDSDRKTLEQLKRRIEELLKRDE